MSTEEKMTPSRAAFVLRAAMTYNGSGQATSDELKEAREMAIEALEKYDSNLCPTCGKLSKEAEI